MTPSASEARPRMTGDERGSTLDGWESKRARRRRCTRGSRRHSSALPVLAGVLALTLAAPAWAAPRYALTDLGPGVAWAINDHGVVVGTAGYYTEPKAFVWRAGRRQELGAGVCRDINNAGVIVGQAEEHAVVWKGGKRVTLQALKPPRAIYKPGGESTATSINDRGDIVGFTEFWVREDLPKLRSDKAVFPHLWVWSRGQLHDLGDSGSKSGGVIDARGDVAGSSAGRAAIWRDYRRPGIVRTPNHLIATVRGLNDTGDAVGTVYANAARGYGTRPFLWSNGKMTMLPGGEGDAYSINARKQIVGATVTMQKHGAFPFPEQHATLWTSSHATDLNAAAMKLPGWTLAIAYSINARGQIVGVAKVAGRDRAFLLTPKP